MPSDPNNPSIKFFLYGSYDVTHFCSNKSRCAKLTYICAGNITALPVNQIYFASE
jgi:hypothetical protein